MSVSSSHEDFVGNVIVTIQHEHEGSGGMSGKSTSKFWQSKEKMRDKQSESEAVYVGHPDANRGKQYFLFYESIRLRVPFWSPTIKTT